MRWRIGAGFGVPVYVHWTFLLLPLWVAWQQPENSAVALPVVLTVLGLSFFCVVLHEFGHILMARRFGIPTQDVTLYPIGGVARLMRMTDKPLEEFLIAVAGPAVNVVIAIVLAMVLVPLVWSDFVLKQTDLLASFGGQVLVLLFGFNVIMVPFNMLPAFPMDGGRVLRALLSAWLGFYQGTRLAVGIGFGMALLMGMAGMTFLDNYMLPIIAIFIIFAGQQELMVAKWRERERRQREWQGEEPLEVLPVQAHEPRQAAPQLPILMLQPKISVYTWDNRTGTWRQEPSTPI